jgi:hypothetical protein
MTHRTFLGLASALSISLAASWASAQYPPPQPYQQPYQQPYPQPYQQPYPPQQQYYGGGGYSGGGGYGGSSTAQTPSSALEIGYLYVTATAYGVGTGIWLDAEIPIEDPGLRFIPPVLLGAVAPLVVFLADHPPMNRGMPAAIATGMIIGAGEGLGITSYQWVSSKAEDEWGFRALARAELIGGLVGGAGGWALAYFLKPSPKTSMFIASATSWGTIIGSQFGGGASNGTWGEANDTVSLSGLIGFNVGLASAVTVSVFFTPSWNQLKWMWIGMGLGQVVSLPVYAFYGGSDYDPRRGLIFQGVAATIGIGVGAIIGDPDGSGTRGSEETQKRPAFARLLGGSLMPVEKGIGAQVVGELW